MGMGGPNTDKRFLVFREHSVWWYFRPSLQRLEVFSHNPLSLNLPTRGTSPPTPPPFWPRLVRYTSSYLYSTTPPLPLGPNHTTAKSLVFFPSIAPYSVSPILGVFSVSSLLWTLIIVIPLGFSCEYIFSHGSFSRGLLIGCLLLFPKRKVQDPIIYRKPVLWTYRKPSYCTYVNNIFVWYNIFVAPQWRHNAEHIFETGICITSGRHASNSARWA